MNIHLDWEVFLRREARRSNDVQEQTITSIIHEWSQDDLLSIISRVLSRFPKAYFVLIRSVCAGSLLNEDYEGRDDRYILAACPSLWGWAASVYSRSFDDSDFRASRSVRDLLTN